MPAVWDLPRQSGQFDSIDLDRFNRLPVQVAQQTTKQLPMWTRWQTFLGSRPWSANQGDILQGVITEMPPVTKQNHTPNNITAPPKKTVVSHFERGNQARIKRHLFESPLMHFLSSFRDFRKNQIPMAVKALNKIVGTGLDAFLRYQVLQQSPRIGIVNPVAGTNMIEGVAFGEATDSSIPKTAAILANLATKIGPNTGFLDFRQICAFRQRCKDELGFVPWDGVPATPKENETMKGKFLLVGESLIYDGLQFDEHVLNFKDYAVNLINSPFRGIIQGNITFMEECFPHRFLEDGTFPEPELELADGVTYPTGNTQGHETVPNPEYVNAPFGIAYFMGYQPYESIKVGPPPSEFAGKSISMGRYHSLNWNGEVRITDDVLVNYGNGVTDTNKYGEWLQLICDTVMGIIPNTPRFCLPVIYRRNLTPSLNYGLTA